MFRKVAIGCGGILGVLVLVVVLVAVYQTTRGINTSQQGSSSQSGSSEETSEQASSGKSPSPPAAQEPEPITLSGVGQMATEPFNLESGLAIFKGTHQGQRNFIVKVLDMQGKEQPVVNAIGNYDGSQADQTNAGQHLLNVQADGPWTVTIEQPRPSSAPEKTRFTGNGPTATELFQLPRGTKTFNLSHQGQRNFIVHLHDKNGKTVGSSMSNAIGAFEGSKAVNIPKDDIYLLNVKADGPWSIDVS